MTQGLPPKPTCLSMIGGVLLAGLILAFFGLLPSISKWVGAGLTFVPSRLGLIQMVTPGEVMKVDFSASPTAISFVRPGTYALYTSNLDLLSINDAVLAAKAKPWIKLIESDGSEAAVTLVERGLALYDTPFARGRPVATFSVARAGTYSMTHPARPDVVYIVPDYTSGREGLITSYMLLELAALGVAGYFLRRRFRRRPVVIAVPPPSRASRERFVAEQTRSDIDLESGPTRSWGADRSPPQEDAEASSLEGARDVLGMVKQNEMTAAEAEVEIEGLLISQPAGTPSANWGAKLALSRSEAAAYSQGAGVRDLLAFRDRGWPTTCAKCGAPLDHSQLDWWFIRDEQGAPALRHIDCPSAKTRP